MIRTINIKQDNPNSDYAMYLVDQEIKYSKAEYTISKEYESALRQKVEAFRAGSGSKKAIHLTMITTYGLTENPYAQTVQNCITMNDLFQ